MFPNSCVNFRGSTVFTYNIFKYKLTDQSIQHKIKSIISTITSIVTETGCEASLWLSNVENNFTTSKSNRLIEAKASTFASSVHQCFNTIGKKCSDIVRCTWPPVWLATLPSSTSLHSVPAIVKMDTDTLEKSKPSSCQLSQYYKNKELCLYSCVIIRQCISQII